MYRAIFLGLILSLLSYNLIYAQGAKIIGIDKLANVPAFQKPKSVETEVKDAALFLSENVKEEDRPYIRFFTNYAVPESLKDDCWLQLSFVIHSLVGISSDDNLGNAGSYYPIGMRVNTGTQEQPEYKIIVNNRVSDSLVWVDIRNFNWTPQSWENTSEIDGYFIKPIIQEDLDGYIRLLAGNAVVRADWFIDHAMNTRKQKDSGLKTFLYRELLYSLNAQPKNVVDFENIWGPRSIQKSRSIGNEYLTLTVNENQTVARHNRILAGYRTEIGWYFRTYDVLSETGQRDYVNSFFALKGKPPAVFDAGELIASNSVHMQVYDLINDKGDIIEDADAAAARHIQDVIGDVRVKVGTSCADCHSGGPIPSDNSIKDFLKLRMGGLEFADGTNLELKGKINIYDYADKLRIERAYLSNKFEDFVDDSQVMFARALLKVNGLTPEENVKSYNKMIKWYNEPLDMKQVELETGYPEETILEKAGGLDLVMHERRQVPGRLSFLIISKLKIPRESWEYRNRDGIPGTFQQTMLMVKGLTEKKEIVTEQLEKPVYVYIEAEKEKTIQLDGQYKSFPVKTAFKYIETTTLDGGYKWYKIEHEGKQGWVAAEISKLGY